MAKAIEKVTWEEELALMEREKNRLPEAVQQGTKEATFDELAQAVAGFCDSHCDITNVGALDCPCFADCPLYPYREGARAVEVLVGHA